MATVGAIIVREPRPSDGPALGEVHVLAWQVGYRSILPKAFLDGLDPGARAQWWTERFTTGTEGHDRDRGRCTHLVAELDGLLAGGVTYGIYRPAAPRPTSSVVVKSLSFVTP